MSSAVESQPSRSVLQPTDGQLLCSRGKGKDRDYKEWGESFHLFLGVTTKKSRRYYVRKASACTVVCCGRRRRRRHIAPDLLQIAPRESLLGPTTTGATDFSSALFPPSPRTITFVHPLPSKTGLLGSSEPISCSVHPR